MPYGHGLEKLHPGWAFDLESNLFSLNDIITIFDEQEKQEFLDNRPFLDIPYI